MVVITGSSGRIGSALKEYYPTALCPTTQEWDIRQESSTYDYYERNKDVLHKVEVIIHCAGLVNKKCIGNEFEAMRVNVQGTANVVSICKLIGAKVVYISTEYIFQGTAGPYSIDDQYRPINYYGETKLAGEFVVKALPKHLIIRASLMPDVFPFKSAFVDNISSKIPLSKAIGQMVELIDAGETGTRHICGKRQSLYEYAIEQGFDVDPIYENDGVVRPKDSSLC